MTSQVTDRRTPPVNSTWSVDDTDADSGTPQVALNKRSDPGRSFYIIDTLASYTVSCGDKT